jgi:hypothetical protein
MVYKLAKDLTGWPWERLYRELKLHANTDMQGPNAKRIAANLFNDGAKIPFDKFIVACRLAKIPRMMGVVLWAKASIPDEYSNLRQNIGLTYKGLKPQSWPGTTPENKEMLKRAVTMGAKMIPDDPKDIRSGMVLKPPRTRY